MAAESTFIEDQTSTSAFLYEHLYKVYPRDKQILLGYSQISLAMGQLEKGSKILQDHLKLQGPDAEVITNLAIIMLESGQIEESEVLYRKALALGRPWKTQAIRARMPL